MLKDPKVITNQKKARQQRYRQMIKRRLQINISECKTKDLCWSNRQIDNKAQQTESLNHLVPTNFQINQTNIQSSQVVDHNVASYELAKAHFHQAKAHYHQAKALLKQVELRAQQLQQADVSLSPILNFPAPIIESEATSTKAAIKRSPRKYDAYMDRLSLNSQNLLNSEPLNRRALCQVSMLESDCLKSLEDVKIIITNSESCNTGSDIDFASNSKPSVAVQVQWDEEKFKITPDCKPSFLPESDSDVEIISNAQPAIISIESDSESEIKLGDILDISDSHLLMDQVPHPNNKLMELSASSESSLLFSSHYSSETTEPHSPLESDTKSFEVHSGKTCDLTIIKHSPGQFPKSRTVSNLKLSKLTTDRSDSEVATVSPKKSKTGPVPNVENKCNSHSASLFRANKSNSPIMTLRSSPKSCQLSQISSNCVSISNMSDLESSKISSIINPCSVVLKDILKSSSCTSYQHYTPK